MATQYGYARVSTTEQDLGLQLDALHSAGVHPDNVVQEKASGAKDRPALTRLLAKLEASDSLLVWKADRLGRDMIGLATLARDLEARSVRLVVLTLGLDTTTPAGRMVLGIMANLAQFEREQLLERVNAGIAAAKRRGVHTGRPHRLTPHQRAEAKRMAGEGKTLGVIAAHFNVSTMTAWRATQQ